MRNGRPPARSSVRAILAMVVAGGVAAASCDRAPEGPDDQGSQGDASVAVAASLPAGIQTGTEEVFAEADRLRVRLVRSSDEEVVVDRVLEFDPGAEETAVSVRVSLSGDSEDFALTVRVRRGDDPLFQGSADLTLVPGRTTEVEVPLEPVPAGVTILTEGPVVFQQPGERRQAEADVHFATGDPIPGLDPGWSSRNPQVAEVTSDGLISASSPGETFVLATITSFADSLLVRVLDVASVEVTPESATVVEGDAVDFDAVARDSDGLVVEGADFTWRSTNTSVATVDGTGRAITHDRGTTRIVASAGGSADTARLAVDPQVASVRVMPQDTTVFESDTVDFDATARDSEGRVIEGAEFTWRSTDDSVATVDGTGQAIAQSAGNTLIVASTSGVADTATLEVQTQVLFSPGSPPLLAVMQEPGVRSGEPEEDGSRRAASSPIRRERADVDGIR